MKTLKGNVTEKDRVAFQKEMNMMKSMANENVVKFIGSVVSTDPGDNQIKILLELINQGSLDKLLRKGKVTMRGKCKICLQAAKGMRYLHHHRIIHRDLAARNILVHMDAGGGITAKVSDFGLSHTDDSGTGYELKESQRLPLKWLAPECFLTKKWTTASDVWSFGVLMWEVFENGKEPWSGPDAPQTGAALSAHIAAGNHPARPGEVPNEFWDIMLMCWAKEPQRRPSMDEVMNAIQTAYDADKTR